MKPNFVIVRESSSRDFVYKINNLLADGYAPHGNIVNSVVESHIQNHSIAKSSTQELKNIYMQWMVLSPINKQ